MHGDCWTCAHQSAFKNAVASFYLQVQTLLWLARQACMRGALRTTQLSADARIFAPKNKVT
jgi:hypothetical protein